MANQLGLVLAEVSMTAASDHAERKSSGWMDLAGVLLREYAMRHKLFTSEASSAYAYSRGLPVPPDGRAYGSVIRQARRDGFIDLDGYERSSNPRHHADIASRWKSKIYRGKQ